jgi:hypothetical protein
VCWPLLTIGRLCELRLSWLWILPILVPIFTALIAVFDGWPLVVRIAEGIAFVFQLPLFLLPKPKDLLTVEDLLSSKVENSGSPIK